VASLDLTAAEASSGVGTEQIIVALIGGLALILVALIPVLITSAKRGASTTTPASPGVTISPEEAERLWNAIEKLRNDQARAARQAAGEHGGIDARIAETRRDIETLSRDLGKLRDGFHRHAGASGHRPRGPDTDA
jgi:hypothetical protein